MMLGTSGHVQYVNCVDHVSGYLHVSGNVVLLLGGSVGVCLVSFPSMAMLDVS